MRSSELIPIAPDHLAAATAFCRRYVAEAANGSLSLLVGSEFGAVDVPFDNAIRIDSLDSAEMQRYRDDLAREERELEHADRDASSRSRSVSETKVRPPQITPHEQLIKQLMVGTARRLFLTGDGGTGKTELTRLLAFRLAEQFKPNDRSRCPYRVELKNYQGELKHSYKHLLKAHVAPDDHEWLIALAHAGRVCFIFDGMDEIRLNVDAFRSALASLVSEFGDSAVYIAGRPGSLPMPLSGFSTHELQPLRYGEIYDFARAVFKCRFPQDLAHADGLAASFITELRSKQSSLDPLIFTPFIVSFALQLVCDGKPIPSNPAELIEAGLIGSFEYRRQVKRLALPDNDMCLRALSAIAAHVQVPDWTAAMDAGKDLPGPRMSCTTQEAKRWLTDHLGELPVEAALENARMNRDQLIDKLVPAAGVLFKSGTTLTFTNRVLTEFLAARWIASYGYPNWPCRNDPYVPVAVVENERRRSLYDFTGDFIWSDQYEGLLRAVWFEIDRQDKNLLIDLAEWVWNTARPLGGTNREWAWNRVRPRGEPNRDSVDSHRTLCIRLCRVLQAFGGSADSSAGERARALVDQILPPQSIWWNDLFLANWSSFLPAVLRNKFRSAPLNGNYELTTTAAMDFRRTANHSFQLDSVLANDELGRDALLEALDRVMSSPAINSEARASVVANLAKRFAGDMTVAVAICRVGHADNLTADIWRPWVVLVGAASVLRTYALGGWRLNEAEQCIRAVAEILDPHHAEHRQMVIVAPREQIRRGLPVEVLEEILIEYFHNSDDLASLCNSLRKRGNAPSTHAANWLDVMRYFEEVDPADKIDAVSKQNTITLEALRLKLLKLLKRDGMSQEASVALPYTSEQVVPELATVKQASALLSNPVKVLGQRFGPKTVERLRVLREHLNLAGS